MAIKQLPKQYSADFRLPKRKPLGGVEVDKANPYGKNVFAAWNFANRESWLEDAATGKLADLVGTTTNLKAGDGNLNLFSDGDGNNHRLNLGSITSSNPISLSNASTGNSYTIFTRFRIPSGTLSNAFPRIIDKSTGGGAADGWALSFQVSAGDLTFQIENTTVLSTLGTVPRNEWINVCVTVDNLSTKLYTSFSNTATGTLPAAPTTTTNAAIANWNHSTDRNWDGDIAYIHMHYGAYSESQVKQYWANPYQILKPKSEPVYFTADAGGGTTGTITQTTSAFTQSLAGNIVNAYTGTITQSASAFTQSAVGDVVSLGITGTITQSTASFTQSAAGDVVSSGINGSITQTASAFTQSLAGNTVLNITGTATQTTASFSQVLNGTVAEQITGIINQSTSSFTQSLVGRVPAQWIDKAPAVTSWGDKAPIVTVWTDK